MGPLSGASMSLRFGRKSWSSSSSAAPSKSGAKSAFFETAFDTYADSTDGMIGPEGIEKLCSDKVDPADVLMLVLAWQLEASQMCYFTRDEWKRGADQGLGTVTSMKELKQELQSICAAARGSPAPLRALHVYTHKFCREDRRKNIDGAVAIAMLQLLHGEAYPVHMSSICKFLEGHEAVGKRGISADEWAMLLNF